MERYSDKKEMCDNTYRDRKLILGIVLDATLSFSKIYPQIYYLLEHLIMNLEDRRTTADGLEIDYSVVLLHDEPELIKVIKDGSSIIRAMSDISFYGGGTEGTEALDKALTVQLSHMNSVRSGITEKNHYSQVSEQLIVITDSMEEHNRQSTAFTGIDMVSDKGGFNYGLQQAYIISYEGSYMPMLRMADPKGRLSENCDGCYFGDIKGLISLDEEKTLDVAERMADRILKTC